MNNRKGGFSKFIYYFYLAIGIFFFFAFLFSFFCLFFFREVKFFDFNSKILIKIISRFITGFPSLCVGLLQGFAKEMGISHDQTVIIKLRLIWERFKLVGNSSIGWSQWWNARTIIPFPAWCMGFPFLIILDLINLHHYLIWVYNKFFNKFFVQFLFFLFFYKKSSSYTFQFRKTIITIVLLWLVFPKINWVLIQLLKFITFFLPIGFVVDTILPTIFTIWKWIKILFF